MTRCIIKRLYNYLLDILPDKPAVQLMYLRTFGRLPDLNNPKTLNEKIAWRKLYQRDPRFPIYADKIAVKDEIKKCIGQDHVIETLWTGDRPEDIPFDTLDPPYVIKVNHSSGGNVFIRTKADIDISQIVTGINEQLKYCHGSKFREWGYTNIPKRVLVERMIKMEDGRLPEDYKFYVYDGKVHFIQVDRDRFGKEHIRNFYMMPWQQISAANFHTGTGEIPRPDTLEKMVDMAEKVGKAFDFVRVDLYSTMAGIKFGEMTFYHGAGIEPFTEPKWDLVFGMPWKIKK